VTSGLAHAFIAAREDTSAGAPLTAWEERLDRALGTARAAWPHVDLDGTRFVTHIARHLAANASPESLEALHVGDLYLACACADGLPAAHAAFEARILPEVDLAVARMKLSPSTLDEVRQLVRQRMLVPGPDTPPKLAAYPGTGPLSSWVRAAALWLALDLQRQRTHHDTPQEDSALSLLVDPGDDPELAYLKTTYRAEFNAAFAQALTRLAPRERNLLRLKYLDGLSIDQLGALYGIHRATAARWVVAAQQSILEGTRSLLTERLRITGSQLDSVLRLISSQLDVNLSRLLRSRID
jgi:RNA polymerase sigma-70 factor (ECF subfamily)